MDTRVSGNASSTAIDSLHSEIGIHSRHQLISWIENLKQGALNLIVHPFLPLRDIKFNYHCLFAKKIYCCSVDHCNRGTNTHDHDANNVLTDIATQYAKSYASIFKEHLCSITNHFNSNNRADHQVGTHHSESGVHNYLDKFLPKQPSGLWLLTAQLVLCSVALSYFLIDDVKFVINYFKANKTRRDSG